MRRPPQPIDSATVATHTSGAMRLRIWRQDPEADAGPSLHSVLVTDAKVVAQFGEAIGLDQKPKAAGRCERCAARVRVVFESPLGLEHGAVDLGCKGAPKGSGRYWQAASTTCGEIAIRDPDALAKLVEEAEKKPATDRTQGLP